MDAWPRRDQETRQPAPSVPDRPGLEFGRASEPVDPWTAFLKWLSTILIPDWNGLIGLLPLLLILGVVGPGLSLLALYWMYVRALERRGKVKIDEPEPTRSRRDADGTVRLPAERALLPDPRS